MRARPSRVLLVDDEPSIRVAVQASLEGDGYQVRAEADGSKIEMVAARFRPDIAILDVRLPVGPDGYTLARRLRTSSQLPVLFLSAADGVDDRLAGFRAGGDDYLVKPFAMAELLARVDALLRRAGRPSVGIWEIGDLVIDEGTGRVARDGTPIELTYLEQQLLTVLARHRGQVMSKEQLLRQVWGFDGGDTNVVEVHVSSLRRKLEAHGPRIVHTMRGLGYLLRP
ncbi:MAG: response regulator transcription factor [Actinobacteria bacterium]|nr:response regulator transcription factor [Actinomycetota bacterium]